MRRRRIVLILVVLAATIPALWQLDRHARRTTTAKYDVLVRQIQAGQLSGDEWGTIHLPKDLAGLAIEGTVYTDNHLPCRLMFLVPTSRSADGKLQGYLYSDLPLLPAEASAWAGSIGTVHESVDVAFQGFFRVTHYWGNWYKAEGPHWGD